METRFDREGRRNEAVLDSRISDRGQDVMSVTVYHRSVCNSQTCIEKQDGAEDSERVQDRLLKGIAMMKELTLGTRDYVVSFGECLLTKISCVLRGLETKGRGRP
ncbi:unnamed protein product [Brassica oleracea var. botrytis]|uniref:Uncharacterized protein n=2 Tax=Brassica oleracea TaxID=3712 RepID=A0A0D3CFD9_BRAOL|nr:unnamed protein product [Brassica oleracea]